jgi:predicted dehydrogenase/threonine dehydrogenase-like Zn-dependent dehydrogenase
MLKLISKSDGLKLAEHSLPNLGKDDVIIRTIASCYSKGTESSTSQNHQKSLIKKVIDNKNKISELFLQGDFSQLLKKFNSQKSSVINMGYSASGEVIAVGKNVYNVKVNDTVVIVGQSANHGQFSVVPKGLCVPIKRDVDPLSASCSAIACIALNSVQIANPLLGSNALVIGCGLLGQFLIQFLAASGSKITCVDIEEWRFKASKIHGAKACMNSTEFKNNDLSEKFDSIYIAIPHIDEDLWTSIGDAAKTNADVLMIGAADLNCPRDIFYKKHLNFRSPHSYGPGRGLYDFEVMHQDFPVISKTWDIRSNIATFIELLQSKKVSTDFIDCFKVSDTTNDLLLEALENKKSYSTILDWSMDNYENEKIGLDSTENKIFEEAKRENIALIGYSDFSKEAHIPNIHKNNELNLIGVCNRTPIIADSIKTISKSELSTNIVGTVVISSNHGSHASDLLEMMEHNKLCIVDKPLCINTSELEQIIAKKDSSNSDFFCFMSRRYSKHIKTIKKYLLNHDGPVHADFLFQVPKKDKNTPIYKEGGRLIGEMCHHVDLSLFLFGEPYSITYSDNETSNNFFNRENSSMLISFKNGSSCFIRYTSIGDAEGSKEKIKISFGNKTIETFDFIKTDIISKSKRQTLINEFDKGFESMWNEINQIIKDNNESLLRYMTNLDLQVTKILLREKI